MNLSTASFGLLQRYYRFLKPNGIVHLKTDSRFLYEYTMSVIRENNMQVLAFGTDIYRDGVQTGYPSENRRFATPPISDGQKDTLPELPDLPAVFEVQTFYESMFLKMGLPITYVAFRLEHEGEGFKYPTDFDAAYWREAEGPRRSFSHQPSKQ